MRPGLHQWLSPVVLFGLFTHKLSKFIAAIIVLGDVVVDLTSDDYNHRTKR